MGLDAVRNVKINFIGEDQNLGATTSSIKSQLAAVAAVAAAAAAAIKFVGDETERLDDTAKAFDKSGLASVETFQKLQQVAKLGGSEINKLTKATVRLNRNLFAISQGAGKAANDALTALGLTTEDLADKDATEQLGILGDALLGVANKGERAALAEELLGRSGRDLLPVLKQGSAGLAEMVEAIDKTFTREDLAKAEAYQDALANLEKAANDVKGEVAIGLAPVFTKAADSMRESGETAAEIMPVIVKSLENVAEAGALVIDAMAFSAEVIGAIGRVAGFVGVRLGRLSDAAGDAADSIGEFISESRVADWARESASEIVELTDDAGGLTQRVRAQIPIVEELGQTYDELARAITGAQVAASKLSLIGDAKKAIGAALGLGKSFQEQREGATAATAARSDELVAQAEQSEFLAKLGSAEGESQRIINERIVAGLELRRQAAQLQFAQTQSVEDETKLLAATRSLQVAQASATRRRGGGARVSQAQRLVALGEQSVALLEQEARLSGILANDAESEARAEVAGLEASKARLQLDRQALVMTKARGEFARQELENKIAAKDAQIEALDISGLVAAREREREIIAEVTSIEQARSLAEASAAARRMEMLGNEFAAREILRQQQQQALLVNPPEDEIGRIERKDQLEQLAFDREMDRRQRSEAAVEARAALEEKLHDEELRRLEEKKKKQKAALDAASSFISTGQQFASAVISATIKDEDKRAKAELRARGIAAAGIGALEGVKSLAAFASGNVVQGALHALASGAAFVQSATMLAGNIPGAGAAGGGGGATAAPTADRETSDAARTVESLPAVDREPTRQPTGQQQGGGNVTTIENLNVTGAIDDETVEKIRLGLDNVNNGLEATG